MKTFKQHLLEAIPETLYHGSLKNFDKFSKQTIRRGQAIFLSTSKEYASLYGHIVYEVKPLTTNIFDYRKKDHLDSLSTEVDRILDKEKEKTYDKRIDFYPYTKEKVMTNIKKGRWNLMEQPIIILAIKNLKFKGFFSMDNKDEHYAFFNPKDLKIIDKIENYRTTKKW